MHQEIDDTDPAIEWLKDKSHVYLNGKLWCVHRSRLAEVYNYASDIITIRCECGMLVGQKEIE